MVFSAQLADGGGALADGRGGARRPARMAGQQLHLRAADHAGEVPGEATGGDGVRPGPTGRR